MPVERVLRALGLRLSRVRVMSGLLRSELQSVFEICGFVKWSAPVQSISCVPPILALSILRT